MNKREQAATKGPVTIPAADLTRFVPMTLAEIEARGWDGIDVLLLSGDAHVDHPSFGVPLLARLLIQHGYRVGIVAQPTFPGMRLDHAGTLASWDQTLAQLQQLGRPRLFAGLSSGVVDSMLNNYTANRRRRSEDDYAPGGKGGRRPDEAVLVYSRMLRKAFPDLPLVIGGVEASLRRLVHYDYWKNAVRRSIVAKAEADLLVFGMAETALVAITDILATAQRDAEFDPIPALHELRGVAYATDRRGAESVEGRLQLPGFAELRRDKKTFARCFRYIEREANPHCGRPLVQNQGKDATGRDRFVVVRPAALPLACTELDALYALPFTREPHPIYLAQARAEHGDEESARAAARIPAAEAIRFSVTVNRGCFGGCAFCGLGLHQGKTVQSRSADSVLGELRDLSKREDFTGAVSDLGGPTANMYGLDCRKPEVQKKCRRASCLHPDICKHLDTDHGAQIALLEKAENIPGIKQVRIASGVRYDLALQDQAYLRRLIRHHVGGQLKVAPEHVDDEVLALMRKPGVEVFERFIEAFERESKKAGKEQYLVPYFIGSLPGSSAERMTKVRNWLQSRRWKVQQVQDFVPLPMTRAGVMYWTGLDPDTLKPVPVPKTSGERRRQRELMQPERKGTPRSPRLKKQRKKERR